jgi:hypothetical protein
MSFDDAVAEILESLAETIERLMVSSRLRPSTLRSSLT